MSVFNKPYSDKGVKRELLNRSFGSHGGKYVSAGTVTPPSGYVICKVKVIVEGAVTAVGNVDSLSAVTLPATFEFEGAFTSVTIATGSMIVYYGLSQSD